MKKWLPIFFFTLTSCSVESDLLQEAIQLSREENYEQSRLVYEELVSIDEENALYHNNIGWVLMNLGEYEAAKHHLERAVGLDVRVKASAQANLERLAELNLSGAP